MNKKSQKLYSTLAATALVASAVAPVASADTVETETTKSLTSTQVTVNNLTTTDTITVTGLEGAGTINVYSDSKKAEKIGTATYASQDTVVVTIAAGFGKFTKVYVTNTLKDAKESSAVTVTVPKEETDAPAVNDLSATNNVSLKDTVTVKNLEAKDKVTVYADEKKATKLGTATVKAGQSSVDVTISKGFGTAEKVYVAKTGNGKLESTATAVSVGAEKATATPDASTITVTNNVKDKDKVKVTGLKEKDVIVVYSDDTLKTKIGNATVKKGQTSVEITVSKGFTTEKIYVTRQSTNEKVSGAAVKDVPAEIVTATPDSITFTNNYALADVLTIGNVKAKDNVIVKNGTSVVATATAKEAGKLEIKLKGQVATKDTVTFTIQSENERASGAITVTIPEAVSYNATKKNVVVNGVKKNSTVTLYSDAEKKKKVGSSTATADGELSVGFDKASDATGTVYVTIKVGTAAETTIGSFTTN